MPPKGRKSMTPWFQCDRCESIITNKDVPIHQEKSCPPSPNSWVHGYIRDKMLYSSLEQLSSDDIVKHIPKEEINNIVLLSQSALQICEICIGDPVVISIGGVVNVFKAWPTLEKSLTSVLMTQEALEQISKNCGDLVTVQKMLSYPLPAKDIYISPNSDFEIPDDLTDLLRCTYRGRILCVGNQLSIAYYGKKLQFKIQKFLTTPPSACVDSVQDLAEDFSEIDLEKSSANTRLYKIFEDTIWNISKSDEQVVQKSVSSDSLKNIGGLSDIIIELQELIDLALGKVKPIPGLKATRGILLHGIPGVGKTLLAKALAASSNVNILTINGPEIYSKFFGETESKLKELFNSAKQNAPSIILLDDLDSLCPRRNTNGSDQEKRVVATLLSQLDGLHDSSLGKSVLVLATSRQPDSIDRALRRPGRLDREIEIPVPSPDARHDILQKLLARMEHSLSDAEVRQIALSAHGFVGADLASLCSRAGGQAVKRRDPSRSVVTLPDFVFALSTVKPSAMREVIVEVPCVRWSDIGGQHDLKLKLQQAVEWPLRHPESFARLGISPPRGVLMFGPPGCSKTMIAKALATESKLNFLSIKGPELFSKWVGESERAVREVFRRARQVAPSVVFFDELDALAGERATGGDGGGGSNVQERVLAQLLTELDGVEPLGNVTVVGATNRPDRIDKALLRPGRLDRIVYVPLPDSVTRAEIFAIQLRKTPVNADVDVSELVDTTEGYSGAEVLAVCHEAALKALEEDLTATEVHRSHFLMALDIVTPRTPPSLLQLYENYLQK